MLDDEPMAKHMGFAGHERVTSKYLGDRHLEDWAHRFERFA